jgi:hypothetical protein
MSRKIGRWIGKTLVAMYQFGNSKNAVEVVCCDQRGAGITLVCLKLNNYWRANRV